MTSIKWGKYPKQGCIHSTYCHYSIDGALYPWIESLIGALLRLLPLPPGVNMVPADQLPPPRVAMHGSTSDALQRCIDPLEYDRAFHTATVKSNRRITTDDWYQDVRHFDFDFDDDIQYAELSIIQLI